MQEVLRRFATRTFWPQQFTNLVRLSCFLLQKKKAARR